MKQILEGFDMVSTVSAAVGDVAEWTKYYVRTHGNYDPNAASDATGLKCEDVSRTRQSDAEAADINKIVRDFGVTGQLPQGVRVPTYGDFDGVSDYREALEAIKLAESSFMAMPANVRDRFDNDPGAFVAFCSDPGNLDEMRKLGLAVPAKDPAPSDGG